MEIPIVYPTKFNNRCEIETIIVKTNIMRKEFFHNVNVEAINSCEK